MGSIIPSIQQITRVLVTAQMLFELQTLKPWWWVKSSATETPLINNQQLKVVSHQQPSTTNQQPSTTNIKKYTLHIRKRFHGPHWVLYGLPTELLSSLPRQHVAPEDPQGSSAVFTKIFHVCGVVGSAVFKGQRWQGTRLCHFSGGHEIGHRAPNFIQLLHGKSRQKKIPYICIVWFPPNGVI